MGKKFNLTAELYLAAPKNIRSVVADISSQLKGAKVDINVRLNPATAKSVTGLTNRLDTLSKSLDKVASSSLNTTRALNSLSQAAQSFAGGSFSTNIEKVNKSLAQTRSRASDAKNEVEAFGHEAGRALKRFGAFTLATGAIFGFIRGVQRAIDEAVEFQGEVVKISQVTGKSIGDLKNLTSEVTRLSTSLGVSSKELLNVAQILAQAGLSANDTQAALEALAKSNLSPTFKNMENTTEAAIAAMAQFKIEATDLDNVLGSLNSVAAAYAVESEDLASAIRRTGGVFATASSGIGNFTSESERGVRQLQELSALFTSVRATTRESAESIATGLRTIFARIQRKPTINFLKQFDIELEEGGKFVGAFEAIKRLNQGLSSLDERDLRFSQIVEELGGIRQISKILPLIKNFSLAQDALNVAISGQDSVTRDAILAQQALSTQFTKTRENFLALIREFADSKTFKIITQAALNITNSFIELGRTLKPLLPLITAFATIKIGQGFLDFQRGFGSAIFGKGTPAAQAIGSNLGNVITGNKPNGTSKDALAASLSSNTKQLAQLSTELRTLNTTFSSSINKLIASQISSSNRLIAAVSSLNKALLGNAVVGNKVKFGPGFAAGGPINYGSGNKDDVPALLMKGEYVLNKKAVKNVGIGTLDAINSGAIRKFASGGPVRRDTVRNLSGSDLSQFLNIIDSVRRSTPATGNANNQAVIDLVTENSKIVRDENGKIVDVLVKENGTLVKLSSLVGTDIAGGIKNIAANTHSQAETSKQQLRLQQQIVVDNRGLEPYSLASTNSPRNRAERRAMVNNQRRMTSTGQFNTAAEPYELASDTPDMASRIKELDISLRRMIDDSAPEILKVIDTNGYRLQDTANDLLPVGPAAPTRRRSGLVQGGNKGVLYGELLNNMTPDQTVKNRLAVMRFIQKEADRLGVSYKELAKHLNEFSLVIVDANNKIKTISLSAKAGTDFILSQATPDTRDYRSPEQIATERVNQQRLDFEEGLNELINSDYDKRQSRKRMDRNRRVSSSAIRNSKVQDRQGDFELRGTAEASAGAHNLAAIMAEDKRKRSQSNTRPSMFSSAGKKIGNFINGPNGRLSASFGLGTVAQIAGSQIETSSSQESAGILGGISGAASGTSLALALGLGPVGIGVAAFGAAITGVTSAIDDFNKKKALKNLEDSSKALELALNKISNGVIGAGNELQTAFVILNKAIRDNVKTDESALSRVPGGIASGFARLGSLGGQNTVSEGFTKLGVFNTLSTLGAATFTGNLDNLRTSIAEKDKGTFAQFSAQTAGIEQQVLDGAIESVVKGNKLSPGFIKSLAEFDKQFMDNIKKDLEGGQTLSQSLQNRELDRESAGQRVATRINSRALVKLETERLNKTIKRLEESIDNSAFKFARLSAEISLATDNFKAQNDVRSNALDFLRSGGGDFNFARSRDLDSNVRRLSSIDALKGSEVLEIGEALLANIPDLTEGKKGTDKFGIDNSRRENLQEAVNDVALSRNIVQSLENVLASKNFSGIGDNVDDFGTLINDQLGLLGIDTSRDSRAATIVSRLEATLKRDFLNKRSNAGDKANTQDILDEVIRNGIGSFNESLQQQNNFLIAEARRQQAAAEALADAQNRYLSAINETVAKLVSLNRVGSEAELRRLEIRGINPNLQQLNAGFNNELNILTGTNNIDDIGAEIKSMIQSINKFGPPTEAAAARFTRLNQAINLVVSDTTRFSNAMKKAEEASKKRNTLEDFAFKALGETNPVELFKQADAFRLAGQVQKGDASGLNRLNLGNFLNQLPQLENLITTFQGENAGKQFRRNALIGSLQARGLDKTDFGRSLIENLAKFSKEENEARAAAENALNIQVRAAEIQFEAAKLNEKLARERVNEATINVRRNKGGLIPGRGPNKDSVFAHLTKGEFVVNRNATDANLPLLMAINNGYNKGGKAKKPTPRRADRLRYLSLEQVKAGKARSVGIDNSPAALRHQQRIKDKRYTRPLTKKLDKNSYRYPTSSSKDYSDLLNFFLYKAGDSIKEGQYYEDMAIGGLSQDRYNIIKKNDKYTLIRLIAERAASGAVEHREERDKFIASLSSQERALGSSLFRQAMRKAGKMPQSRFNQGGSAIDNIPAMLTKGEFVVNAKAARANYKLLNSINNGNVAKFNKGGSVGNPNPSSQGYIPNLDGLTKALMDFSKYSQSLLALNIPEKITVEVAPIQTIFTLTGETELARAIVERFDPYFRQLVYNEISKHINTSTGEVRDTFSN